MATLSNWSENLPSDSSLMVKAPSYVRSIWRDIAAGMTESRSWPGSGGGSNASHGELKPGASKAWFAAASLRSFGATATHRGRPFFASDTSRLYTYASDRTHIVGTPFLQEHTDYFTGAYWLEQSGSYTTDTGGAGAKRVGIVPLIPAYSGIPVVFARTDDTNIRIGIKVDSGGEFESSISGPIRSVFVRWTSLGTVTLL